jgi:hypothetical protein
MKTRILISNAWDLYQIILETYGSSSMLQRELRMPDSHPLWGTAQEHLSHLAWYGVLLRSRRWCLTREP